MNLSLILDLYLRYYMILNITTYLNYHLCHIQLIWCNIPPCDIVYNMSIKTHNEYVICEYIM